MTPEELLANATPRPWTLMRPVDELSPGGQQAFVGIKWYQGPKGGWWDEDSTSLSQENAALIVSAVNNYERLLKIEKAARECLSQWKTAPDLPDFERDGLEPVREALAAPEVTGP